MNPFRRLGIARSADEREIRRAYARLLKQTRPDDDPVGFQQLHEAYQACLAQAQRRPTAARDRGDAIAVADPAAPVATAIAPALAWNWPVAPVAGPRPIDPPRPDAARDGDGNGDGDGDSDGDGAGAGDDGPTGDALPVGGEDPDDASAHEDPFEDEDDTDDRAHPATVHPEVAFAPHAFLDELIHRAADGPAPLRQWLQANEALYSLRLKEAMAMPSLQALCRHPDAATEPNCAVVMDFFAIDPLAWQTRNLLDSLTAHRQRRHAEAAFARGVLPIGSGTRRWIDDLIDRELSTPPKALRHLYLLFWPGAPTQVAARILQADEWAGAVARERIPAPTRRRFLALADRSRFIWQRWLLTLTRVFFWYGLVCLLIVANGTRPLDAGDLLLPLGCAGVFIGWQGLRAAVLWAQYWYARHAGQRENVYRGGVLLGALASLSLGALTTDMGMIAGYCLAVMLAGLVASEKRLGAGLLILGMLFLSTFALADRGIDVPGLPPGLAGAVAAPLLMLGWDTWRNRTRRWPLAAVRGEARSLWPLVGAMLALMIGSFALV